MDRKIGLLFGAGAEIAYGLPSGGKFALDIFKADTKKDKEYFRSMIKKIDTRSSYSFHWLPDEFTTKPITTFGKNQYEQLIISSLENKRDKILNFLNNFDNYAEQEKKELEKKNIHIDEVLHELAKREVGSFYIAKDIILNTAFKDQVTLFNSKYFSILLHILSLDIKCEGLKGILKSFIELLIGALGEEFIHKINDTIFEKKPDDIDIFDDFCGFFSFDYNHISGLDIVLSNEKDDINEKSSGIDIVTYFSRDLLENLFCESLDYQSLIDSYYSYLFKPKTDWAKFCKICIFLHTVRRYITEKDETLKEIIINNEGYYSDLINIKDNIYTIGSSNYNKFIDYLFLSKKIQIQNIYYLNGSVDDFYDPYKNKIISKKDSDDIKRITVPLLFTQSGIKPLTSVLMARRYVDYYDKLSKCNVIGIIGYGCNADDGHINGLIRELIEEDSKTVVIFSYGDISEDGYFSRLRIENPKHLKVCKIDINRKIIGENKFWYEKLNEIIDEGALIK